MKDRTQLVLALYFIAVIFNSILGIILQAKLLIVTQNLARDVDNPEIKIEMIKILDLMLLTGQLFRGCGAIALCYNSIIAAGFIVYCLPNVIQALRVFDYSKESGSVAFFMEPDKETERTGLKIDKILNNIIESNMNLTKVVINKLDEDHYLGNNELPTEKADCFSLAKKREKLDDSNGEEFFLKLIDHQNASSQIKQRGSLAFSKEQNDSTHSKNIKPFIKDHSRNKISNFGSIAATIFLVSLQDQLEYLIKLKHNKRRIWPSNRNANWAKTIKLLGTLLNLVWLISMWLFSQFVSYLGVISSFEFIKSSGFGANYQRVTLMDRLMGSNVFLVGYFSVLMSCKPCRILFVTFLDMIEHFYFIKSKIGELNYKLYCLRSESNLIDHNRLYITMKEYELTKKVLYQECDKSVVELYICYRIFKDELKSGMRLAQGVLSQTVSFNLIVVGPTLPFMSFILIGNAGLVAIAVTILIFIAESTLTVCGAIHAYCLKYSRRIWSFIAFAEGYNLDTFNHISHFNQLKIFRKLYPINPSIFHNIGNNKSNKYDFEPDFDYHSQSFITYHTMFLWRQLATHEALIHDHSIVKLYGFLEVDYRSIIKYNYWIFSVILLVLSGTLTRI